MKPVGHIPVPVVKFKGDLWGALSEYSASHEIVATSVKITKKRIPFLDGHRVDRVKLTSMVHWKIPTGVDPDISAVPPSGTPRRRR